MLQDFTFNQLCQTFPKAVKGEDIKRGQFVQISNGTGDTLEARSFAASAYGTPTTTPLIGVAAEDSSPAQSAVRVVLGGEAEIAISPLSTTNYNSLAAATIIPINTNPTDRLVSTGVAGELPVRKRQNILSFTAGSVYFDVFNSRRYARVFL